MSCQRTAPVSAGNSPAMLMTCTYLAELLANLSITFVLCLKHTRLPFFTRCNTNSLFWTLLETVMFPQWCLCLFCNLILPGQSLISIFFFLYVCLLAVFILILLSSSEQTGRKIQLCLLTFVSSGESR